MNKTTKNVNLNFSFQRSQGQQFKNCFPGTAFCDRGLIKRCCSNYLEPCLIYERMIFKNMRCLQTNMNLLKSKTVFDIPRVKMFPQENIMKFPLAQMGVLVPGSAHARPFTRPPIDTSGNFPAHMSAESPLNISPNLQQLPPFL